MQEIPINVTTVDISGRVKIQKRILKKGGLRVLSSLLIKI
nr:MAG TPA: hypothetical protein [Caudoviricetes sp.]